MSQETKKLSRDYQLLILQALYPNKSTNEFQLLSNSLLNIKPQEEKYEQLTQLSNYGLVVFEKVLNYEKPAFGTFDMSTSAIEMIESRFNDEPIRARITDLGIEVIERYNTTQK